MLILSISYLFFVHLLFIHLPWLSKFQTYYQVPGLATFANVAALGNNYIVIAVNVFGDKNIQFAFDFSSSVTGTFVAFLFGKSAFAAAFVTDADSSEIPERAS